MRAMVLRTYGEPLQLEERAIPTPGPHQLLIKVLACGVCRTDLHLVDGEYGGMDTYLVDVLGVDAAAQRELAARYLQP